MAVSEVAETAPQNLVKGFGRLFSPLFASRGRSRGNVSGGASPFLGTFRRDDSGWWIDNRGNIAGTTTHSNPAGLRFEQLDKLE